MQSHKNIILVGLMGSGKSTVGRLLSRQMQLPFHDTDQEIVRRTGVSIPMIFEVEGEAGFRRREEQVLSEMVNRDGVVLATGGGIVLSEANRKLIREHGTVIYLRASVDELWARTRHDKNRPLLQVEDPKARLSELLTARDPLYREVADLIVDTGRQPVQALVGHLVRQLRFR